MPGKGHQALTVLNVPHLDSVVTTATGDDRHRVICKEIGGPADALLLEWMVVPFNVVN